MMWNAWMSCTVVVVMGAGILSCGQSETPAVEQETAGTQESAWQSLFDGATLDGWQTANPESWVVDNGVLAGVGKGDLWTTARYGDFILECDYKISAGGNSGVFIRTGDIANNVQTGIEVQILDGSAKSPKNENGAIYDCLGPSATPGKAAGEWNSVQITCAGASIRVVLNDVSIIDMDLDRWDTPGQNPDGAGNKFKSALKDFPRDGHIGFQFHGDPVWFRNVRIKAL